MERPSENIAESREKQEIVQLWINSHAASKNKIPEYIYLSDESMPLIYSEDEKIAVKLISGQIGNLKGRIKGESPLFILWSNGSPLGKHSIEIPNGYNASIYLIKGQIKVSGFRSC